MGRASRTAKPRWRPIRRCRFDSRLQFKLKISLPAQSRLSRPSRVPSLGAQEGGRALDARSVLRLSGRLPNHEQAVRCPRRPGPGSADEARRSGRPPLSQLACRMARRGGAPQPRRPALDRCDLARAGSRHRMTRRAAPPDALAQFEAAMGPATKARQPPSRSA